VVQQLEPDFIGGSMLVPVPGAPVAACNSRKASVIYSIGQPRPVCNVVTVTWNRTRNVSTEQAANQESAADLLAAYNAAQAQPQSSAGAVDPSVDSSLLGVWSNESATAVSYMKTRLVLRADGTYTKTFGARPPTMGGGVVGAPTW
jgi:hypothetical protein